MDAIEKTETLLFDRKDVINNKYFEILEQVPIIKRFCVFAFLKETREEYMIPQGAQNRIGTEENYKKCKDAAKAFFKEQNDESLYDEFLTEVLKPAWTIWQAKT